MEIELLKEMLEQQKKMLDVQKELIEVQRGYLTDNDKKFDILKAKLERFEELLENIWANG